MISTGITRRVDELGRIVIPAELRRTMNIYERDQIEIFSENDRIILKKHEDSCIFCGGDENLSLFKEKYVCSSCLEKLREF